MCNSPAHPFIPRNLDPAHDKAAKHDGPSVLSRRTLLGGAMSCGAYTLFALAGASAVHRRAFAQQTGGEVVATEPFARVERLAENAWAVVSTTAGGRMQTVSNGGIIAGREGVLVIEGLNTVEGGAWLSRTARELTGRWPTHVALTHFHGDHSNGLAGHLQQENPPAILSTLKTRELLLRQWGSPPASPPGGGQGTQGAQSAQSVVETGEPRVVPNAILVDTDQPTLIDLGGRSVRLTPRLGHTPSDLTIELTDPKLTWCGDLFFNRMFPYYGDAIPSKLSATCAKLLQDKDTTFVPGHGPVATREDIANFLGMIENVGEAARKAFAAGKSADEAWREYEIPESLGNWAKFRDDVYRFAFEAWERELKGS